MQLRKIGKEAFKGCASKIQFAVPKGKQTVYAKLLKEKIWKIENYSIADMGWQVFCQSVSCWYFFEKSGPGGRQFFGHGVEQGAAGTGKPWKKSR